MYNDEFLKASREKKETLKILTEVGENDEIKEFVTKLNYNPVQTLMARYEYVKMSREEGNFEFFKKIADFLADKFKYSMLDSADYYEACAYCGSNAYDFKFILSLSRFYQKNKTLFDGHFDIIKRMCESNAYYYPYWEEVKEFWIKHTTNR